MLRLVVGVIGVTSVLSVRAVVQGGGTVSGATPFGNNYHLGFERPEAWGLKYFASTTLLSGLATPEPIEGHRVGSIAVGFELGWLPALDAGQQQIGFNGKAPQDLNQAPVLMRPVVRVGANRRMWRRCGMPGANFRWPIEFRVCRG